MTKFKVGDKVNFILVSKVISSGIITEVKPSRTLKTYTFVTAEGKEQYSDSEFLQLA